MYVTRILAIVLLLIVPNKPYPQFRLPELPKFLPPPEITQSKNVKAPPPTLHNLEETIKEVEYMLIANPELPRLTRGEILDLLENITKSDTLQQDISGMKSSQGPVRDPKAVMLVKPYTPENEEIHNMEELYTKAPVTQIVGLHSSGKPLEDNTIKTNEDPAKFTKAKTPVRTRNRHRKTTTSTTTSTTTTTTTPASATSSGIPDLPSVPHFVQRNQVRRRRTTTTTSTTTALPETTYPPRGKRPLRRRPSTVKYHNHRYPGDPEPEVTLPPLPSGGLKLITPPNLDPLTINEDLLDIDHQKEEVSIGTNDVGNEQAFNNYVVWGQEDVTSQGSTALPTGIGVPQDLKDVITDMSLDSLIEAKPPKLQQPSEPLSGIKTEQYNLDDMLAAFRRVPPTKFPSTTIMPDIKSVADNLNPEMKELLMSFGLIPNTQKISEKPPSESLILENYNQESPETKPEAYLGFKPLPDDDTSRDEMRELLARFGLGRDARKQKALPKKSEDDTQGDESDEILSFDMIPEEYRETIENLGLDNRRGKMIRAEALTKSQEKQHVFNPEGSQFTTEEEMKKIQNLLEFVRKLENLNGSVTEDDLRKIGKKELKEFIATLNEYNRVTPLNEQAAPNPIHFEDGLDKNEVKRQENSSSVVDVSTTETSAMNGTEMLSEGPSIKDLEDSFGGQTDPAPTTRAPPETTTLLRKTGFYYLVDWNSFFDIDDQKGKRVNLRFQPTVGDPKRFLSVSIP